MKTQRVVLHITVNDDIELLPENWDFFDLLAIDGVTSNMDIDVIEDMPLLRHHVEQMIEPEFE